MQRHGYRPRAAASVVLVCARVCRVCANAQAVGTAVARVRSRAQVRPLRRTPASLRAPVHRLRAYDGALAVYPP